MEPKEARRRVFGDLGDNDSRTGLRGDFEGHNIRRSSLGESIASWKVIPGEPILTRQCTPLLWPLTTDFLSLIC